jgi:RNA recognition motif-containing protein
MANEDAKLFVAGLPDSVSEDGLKQIFEAVGGTVVNVSLPKDRATGRPRGFGFVTMATAAEAQVVRDSLDGSLQAGKSISVRPFQAEPPRRDALGGPVVGGPPRMGGLPPRGAPPAPGRKLYVGNLPYDATVEEVETLINASAAGSVVRVHLPMDADGRKRGFGFVTMASPEVAKTASEALRAADLRGRRLVVNLAHPKGDRPVRTDRPSFGGGGGYAGGGGGGGGFAPSQFGPPAPSPSQRKTFDERKKKTFNEDGGGPKNKRGGGRPERDDTRGGGRFGDYGGSGGGDDD